MFQVTRTLTTALAGVALASLPIVVGAQGAATPQQKPARETAQQHRSTADQNSPQHHLAEAERVLNSITAKGEASAQIAELRRHFAQLKSAWQVSAAASARSGAAPTGHAGGHTATTGTTGGTTSGTPAATTSGTTGTPEQPGATGATMRQTPSSTATSGTASSPGGNWMTHYQAIDTVLDKLLAEGPANTSLDAGTRTKLTEFRTHIDQFHTTAMSQSRSGGEDATARMQTPPSTAPTEPMPTPPPSSASPASERAAGVDSAAIARLSAQIDDLMASASTSSTSATAPGAVGTTGTATTTGTICVDRAKLEQLKRDIQLLQK